MMNRVIVWGILCVMFYGYANGQDVWNDQAMDSKPQDHSLFQSLIDSSIQVKDNTVKKQLLLQALEIAQNEKDNRKEAKASFYLGKMYHQTGNTTEANLFFIEVHGFIKERPDDFSPEQKAMVYFLTGKNYSYLNQYQKSLEFFKNSQIICEQNSISDIQIDVLRQIGNVFFYLGDIASSTNYYYESLRLAQEHNNTPKEVDALNNIATNMIDIGKENDAKKLFQQALKLAQANNMAGRIATISNNLGVIFFNEHQLEKATDYFNLALSFAMDREDVYSKGIYYNNLAKVYIELGNFQKARSLMEKCFANISIVNDKAAFSSYYATKSKYYIMTKHFDSASIYINKVLAVSKELSSINYRKNYYFLKYEYYKAQDDYQRALENYIRNQQIADSITSQESNHKIAQLQAYYKQQKENERYSQLLEQKSNLRQYLLLATILSFLVIASMVYAIIIQKRASRRIKAQNKRFKSQQSQLAAKNHQLSISQQKLEEVNRDRNQLFSIISHDLRSPFNSLLGFSEMLQEEVKEDNDVETVTMMSENIYKSSMQLFELIQNLLEWANTERGKLEYKPSNLVLRKVIDENLYLAKHSAVQKSVELLNNVDDSIHVYADLNMLNTILRNLIFNAIKFTPKQGAVTILAEENNKGVVFHVKDSGVGMSEEDRHMILFSEDTFTRKGTEDEKGAGLGLVLTKNFVNRHKGSIDITTEIGRGTTFHITIPAKALDA